ncbi:MAG: hypothetical protein HZB26_06990 [Candidatus Hydrogenedentes bacterium]|nr:hypothetical protein [Candidatus Hydrogenedentota bacterium]
MSRILLVLVTLSGAAAAENLLANPGFEELKASQPAHWSVFVMPQTGSWGRLDRDTVLAGKYSVSLHIATPYVVEPANNWSQNIVADLRKASLVVRGAIKTDEATEAAIWLQCFRKTPLATLAVVSTSDTTLIHGTHDWAAVEARLTVPEGTDFIVCRCVLKGSGTAWFDDLSVEKLPADAKRADAQDAAPIPNPNPVPVPKQTTPAPSSVTTPSQTETKGAGGEETRRAFKELLDANAELRRSNKDMQEQIKQLREELRDLRRDIPRDTPKPPPAIPPLPEPPAPPLVPHDYSAEGKP